MLVSLPYEMGNMQQNLKVLDVSRNTLIVPPRPIVDKGTACILDWLQKNRGKEVKVSGLTVATGK